MNRRRATPTRWSERLENFSCPPQAWAVEGNLALHSDVVWFQPNKNGREELWGSGGIPREDRQLGGKRYAHQAPALCKSFSSGGRGRGDDLFRSVVEQGDDHSGGDTSFRGSRNGFSAASADSVITSSRADAQEQPDSRRAAAVMRMTCTRTRHPGSVPFTRAQDRVQLPASAHTCERLRSRVTFGKFSTSTDPHRSASHPS